MLLRALALAALRGAEKAKDKTPVQILEEIVLGRFTSDFTDGKTVISTSEAGGSVSFQLPDSFTPAEVMALAMECIARINSGEYGAADTLPNVIPQRVIKRLRGSFWNASTS